MGNIDNGLYLRQKTYFLLLLVFQPPQDLITKIRPKDLRPPSIEVNSHWTLFNIKTNQP